MPCNVEFQTLPVYEPSGGGGVIASVLCAANALSTRKKRLLYTNTTGISFIQSS